MKNRTNKTNETPAAADKTNVTDAPNAPANEDKTNETPAAADKTNVTDAPNAPANEDKTNVAEADDAVATLRRQLEQVEQVAPTGGGPWPDFKGRISYHRTGRLIELRCAETGEAEAEIMRVVCEQLDRLGFGQH